MRKESMFLPNAVGVFVLLMTLAAIASFWGLYKSLL